MIATVLEMLSQDPTNIEKGQCSFRRIILSLGHIESFILSSGTFNLRNLFFNLSLLYSFCTRMQKNKFFINRFHLEQQFMTYTLLLYA